MNAEGFIYIAGNKLFPDYVKIGRTKNIRQRMKKLGTGVPEPYNVLHCELVINAVEVETRLHREFSFYKKNGEWFEISNIEKIKQKINSIQKDIRRDYENDIEYGETLPEKYERICAKYGVGGYTGYELKMYFECLCGLNSDKIDEAIHKHAKSLLDYHPSVNECW